MGSGERQLHLRLHACDLSDTETSGLTSGVPQQRCLPDARFAPHDENGALAPAHVRQQPVEHLALAAPV